MGKISNSCAVRRSARNPTPRTSRLAQASVVFAALLAIDHAAAVEFASGSGDWKFDWTNDIRYNVGFRAESPDRAILNNTSYDDSDAKFDKGDVVMNRLDVLSQFNVSYRDRVGLRVSAAGWYDQAYHDKHVKTGPLYSGSYVAGLGDASSAQLNNRYSDYVKRWNRGPSGEFLDAFVFANFDVGSVPVSARLGQHTVYWGESIFSFVHGVSYGQGPIDLRKATANPGSQAKEVFLPLPQISLGASLSDSVSIAAQYFFDWESTRFPDGGTYFGIMDSLSMGGGTYLINPLAAAGLSQQYQQAYGVSVDPVPFVPSYGDPKKHGDWGVMAKWSPGALRGGSLGFYYREYTDKLPVIVLGGFQPDTLAVGAPIPSSFGLSYPDHRAKLYGISYSGQIKGMSVGAEVTYREGTNLLMGSATLVGQEPTGNTLHALANAIAYFGTNPLWDSATLTTEVNYSRVQSVKDNPQNFGAYGYDPVTCRTRNTLGCATKDAYGVAVAFSPVWYQVAPGLNLSANLFYTETVHGTSPVLFGGYEGNGNYSIGLTATFREKHSFSLAYNDAFAKHRTISDPTLGGATNVTEIGSIGAQWDRAWVTLTYKTSF